MRLLLLMIIIAGIGLVVHYREQIHPVTIQEWVEGFRLWGPLVFMVLYAFGTILFLPGLVFTLAGGALFGPFCGTLYSLSAATAGATLAFLIARYIAGDWVARQAGGRLKQLLDGVEREGWKFVAVTRLVPLFPFNLLNYGFGLTPIPWHHYVLASFVCMAPGAFAYTYIGHVGRQAAAGVEGVV